MDECRYDRWGRWYPHPSGQWLPSITSVLKINQGDGIARWRRKVGEAEAEAITSYSQIRGTIVHDMMERICKGEECRIEHPRLDPANTRLLRDVEKFVEQLSGFIRASLGQHRLVEGKLISERLWTAGRTDLITADYAGVPSVVDYKNKRRPQINEWMTNYYFQLRFYAEAHWEMSGEIVRQIVVLVAHDEYPEVPPQEWITDAGEYKLGLRAVRAAFERKFQREMGCSTREHVPQAA